KAKVVQQAMPDDPLFVRLSGLLPAPADKQTPKTGANAAGQSSTPGSPIQRTLFQDGTPAQPATPAKPGETPLQRPAPPPPDPPPSAGVPPLPELPPLPPATEPPNT